MDGVNFAESVGVRVHAPMRFMATIWLRIRRAFINLKIEKVNGMFQVCVSLEVRHKLRAFVVLEQRAQSTGRQRIDCRRGMYLKPSDVGGPSLPQLRSDRSPTTVRIMPGFPSPR